jgi:hypothetical protein
MEEQTSAGRGRRRTRRQLGTRAGALTRSGLAGVALAACGPLGAGGAGGAPPRPAQLGPASLTLLTIWGGPRVPLMNQQLERFSQRHPGV